MPKLMEREELLTSLSHYGYPLLSPTSARTPEEVLKTLVLQKESRLLEGFPVVLAGAFKEKEALEWESRKWQPGRKVSPTEKKRWTALLGLSYLLFQLFAPDSKFLTRTRSLLGKFADAEKTVKNLQEPFTRSQPVKAGSVALSTERLKTTFRNYLVHGESFGELAKRTAELELELHLSELFPPKQKELLRKRLEGKSFTKTEKEYFYRVVRKRLRALADQRVYELACRLN